MVRSPAVACPLPSVLGDKREVLVDIELAVVTPLFGGGATTGHADSLLPVRGSSVRGHLRFWWRACHAHLFADAADLFREESEVWGQAAVAGTATGPAPVQVEIEILNYGQSQLASENPWPGYALFPFQGEAEGGGEPTPPTPGRVGVRFRLLLTVTPGLAASRIPELRRAAEKAVAAWILFGGIGARTRRGCGSLWCARECLAPEFVSFRPKGTAPPPAEAARWIQAGTQIWLPKMVEGVPVASQLKAPLLHQARVRAGNPTGIIDAWRTAVVIMQSFSQGSNVGRNPGYGRSRWPEADSARATWPTLDPNPNHIPAHPARPSYPRADLRLPILLQRLGDDPPVLQGRATGATRMASPVILKALPISATQAAPLMVLLNAPHVWDPVAPGVEIESKFGTVSLSASHLQMAPNALSPDAPGLMAHGRTIRDAFVDWAERRLGGLAAEL